jgi:predicted  nucleic acid-binding Zn-ribbon protein
VSKELTELQKTLQQNKTLFLTTAKRATTELERQRKRLLAEISRVNARATKTRLQLQRRSERLLNTTASKAKRELNKQIRKLQKGLEEARNDAAKLRKDLGPVKDDLTYARNHLAHALHIDRALAKIQRQLKTKPAAKKPTRKKTAKKKAPPK